MQASFTIEAAMVMGIILLCLVTAIIFAYRCRDNVFKNYVAGEAALIAAHTEEIWLPDKSEITEIEEYANNRLHVIGRYETDDVKISIDKLTGNATVIFQDDSFTARIADIENYMRISSVIKDFAYKKEKDDDK